MAGTLTDGVVSIPLVYNKATQPAYRMQYGGRLQIPQTTTIEHQPDTSAPLPVFGWDNDRSFFLTLDIGADTPNAPYACQGWDSPLDAITALKRMVDGANQQALRYWTDGDVREVTLVTQADGLLLSTSHSVKMGYVDDGAAFMNNFEKSKVALDVVVALRVSPYGEGDSFVLKNALVGAPGMLAGAGGIANGLNLIGTPTPTLDQTIYLMGGVSQKVVTAVSGTEGFETDNVVLTASNLDILGFVWLYIASGDAITVTLKTDIGTIDSAVLTVSDANNVSDQKVKEFFGNTWYRVPVGGTTIPALTVKLQVQRISALNVTTFYADMVYIALDETVQPLGWAGKASLINDGILENSHLDVYGVAGDSDALVTHKVTLGAAGTDIQNFTVSRGIDGLFLVNDEPYWQDATISYTSKSGAGTWSTQAGGSNGTHEQYLVSGTPTTDVAVASATISGVNARRILAKTRRVFARIKASTLFAKFQFSVTTPDGVFYGAANDVNVINQFELVDLGLLNGRGMLPANPPDTATPDTVFTITITGFTAIAQTAGVDGFYLLFADDSFLLGQTLESIGANSDIWVVGENDGGYVVTETTGQKEPRILGNAYALTPGFLANRLLYTFAESDNLHDIALTYDVVVVTLEQDTF